MGLMGGEAGSGQGRPSLQIRCSVWGCGTTFGIHGWRVRSRVWGQNQSHRVKKRGHEVESWDWSHMKSQIWSFG